MSSASDFIIENGVLKKYTGPGGDVVIPEGVTEIGFGAFYECGSLRSVTILPSVTSIGGRAFFWCGSLRSVTIPDSVTSIGDQAFRGCEKLADSAGFVIVKGVLYDYKGHGGDVTIPEGVTSIGDEAFRGCSSLTSVTIPEGVTSIGESAFFWCGSLRSVTIPESVTSIGPGAFNGSSLTSVAIPESVTSIGNSAFRNCSSLTSVTIPGSVTSIGDQAFAGCRGLTSVTIPESTTSIGRAAFFRCESLTSVTIPEGVTSIGEGAFYCCLGLTNLTIPENVTYIGNRAFGYFGRMESLVVLSDLKLTKDMFQTQKSGSATRFDRIVAGDPGKLPADMRPAAAIGFAEQPDDPKSERGKKHLKYIKANAAKLVKELAHPALLRLLCENKLLTPEATELYLAAAQEAGNTENTALLLDYQQNKLTGKEKAKAAQKAETREEKVTDFVFSAEAVEQLQGKVFVVTGALKSFTRTEFKACLDACGAILSETLNEQTDYLITNTPDSGSAKNKKAEQLGVKKLSEEEFNRLIGRKQY